MRIEYQLTYRDLAKVTEYRLLKSKRYLRLKRIFYAASAVYLIGLLFVFWGKDVAFMFSLIIGTLVLLFFPTLYKVIYLKGQLKCLPQTTSASTFAPSIFTITEEGIENENEYIFMKFSWHQVEKMEEMGKYCCIFIKGPRLWVLPKNQMQAEDYKALTQMLKQYLSQNKKELVEYEIHRTQGKNPVQIEFKYSPEEVMELMKFRVFGSKQFINQKKRNRFLYLFICFLVA